MKPFQRFRISFRLLVILLTGLYFLSQEAFTQLSVASSAGSDEAVINNDTTLPVSVFESTDIIQNPVTIWNSGESKQTFRITITPNPVTEYGTVGFENPEAIEFSARIYNILGEVVRTYTGINSEKFRFDKGNLKPGVYIIRLYQQETRAGSARFLIR